MEYITDSIKSDCGVLETPGYRSSGKPEVAVVQIIKDNREGHPSFPIFPANLLRKIDYRNLHNWMNGLMKTWEAVYELNRLD